MSLGRNIGGGKNTPIRDEPLHLYRLRSTRLHAVMNKLYRGTHSPIYVGLDLTTQGGHGWADPLIRIVQSGAINTQEKGPRDLEKESAKRITATKALP